MQETGLPDGSGLADIKCVDSDANGTPSDDHMRTKTAVIHLDPGETVECTFTNVGLGTITVEKETEPGGAPDSFEFRGDLDTSLKDGERKGNRVRPGTYTVEELVPSGWMLKDISCSDHDSSGDLNTATATFRVKAGENVRCTFTNTQKGTITVKKQTVPTGSDQAFAFSGAITDQLKDGQKATETVAPGTYSVKEKVPAGWDLTGVHCDDSDSGGDLNKGEATFRVKPGEDVTCTFTNTHEDVVDPPGTIIVAKETVPDGDRTTFTFQGDAAGVIADGQRIVSAGLKAGTYTSQEVLLRHWRLASIQCDDGDSSGDLNTATATFRLQPGETVICTFTNEWLNPIYLPVIIR